MVSIAATRRGLYGVRGTWKTATVACDRYGSDGPGISRFETSTEEKGLFPLESSIDGFFNPNFTSTEEEYVLLQPDIGMDDNNETTTQQAAAREEFASPTKKRQQQGMAVWSTDQNRQFDRGWSRVNSLLF